MERNRAAIARFGDVSAVDRLSGEVVFERKEVNGIYIMQAGATRRVAPVVLFYEDNRNGKNAIDKSYAESVDYSK